MGAWQWELQLSVVLNGSGTGTIFWIPSHANVWVNYMTVNVVPLNGGSPVNQSQATIRKNFAPASVLIDSSYTGNSDASDSPWYLMTGQQLQAVWTGGDAGATAFLYMYGYEFNQFEDLRGLI